MGVFDSANFAPKAQPGSCQVFKTVAATSLEGTCNNELPQYVAQFNGASSYILISSGPTLNYNPVTLTSWIYQTNQCSSQCVITIGHTTGGYWGGGLVTRPNQIVSIFDGAGAEVPNDIISAGQWYFVAGSYDGSTIKLYVNGQFISSTTPNSITPNSITGVGIGSYLDGSQFFQGSITNVQIYNTSLSANDVAALYYEGIGGAPQNTQNLVGWWPLNGNANDYSGNNNNGAAVNVVYTGSWEEGYSQP